MASTTRRAPVDRWLQPIDAASASIVKTNAQLPVSVIEEQFSADGIRYRTKIRVNSISQAIASDAALGFGQKIATFPVGLIRPVGGFISMTSTCATGLSATAGEIGLGTTIASGAVATLGGTVGFEDLMEGTTISNHVAATALASVKANNSVVAGTQGATGPAILDGSSSAKDVYLNIASTWNQTAAESVTLSAVVILDWEFVAVGTEV